MSKFTRQAIVDAFMELLKRRSLDKITVKDIIETAQINRNTFYYHYEDIYALLDAVFIEAAEKFRMETPGDSTFYEEYVRAADFFLKNKEAIIHVYNSKSKDVLTRYMESATKHFVSRFVKKASENTGLSEEGMQYITSFYGYAIVGNTMHWVEQGLPEYSINLLYTISESFEATVDVMIKNYIDKHNEIDISK